MSTESIFIWLVNGTLASSVLLFCGVLAVEFCRQPADRLRIIQWTFVAAILALVFLHIPSFSGLSLGVLDATQEDTTQLADDDLMPVSQRPIGSTADLSSANVDSGFERVGRTDERPSTPTATPITLEKPAAASDQYTKQQLDLSALAIRAICLAYIVGAVVFLVRWLVALSQLRRIRRCATDAPAAIHAELLRIAGQHADRVQLLASGDVSSPITWGAARPVIVLPTEVIGDSDTARLRYYLAHEWAHVRRGDYRVWQLATLLQFFLYYHPLFWWMRRRLATSMDQLADAAACDQGPSTADYAAFLVALARRQLTLAPRLALSINDKQSPLRQRVVYLLNAAVPPRAICPPARNLAIAVAAMLLGVAMSTVRLDAQPQGDSSAMQGTPSMPGVSSQPAAAAQVGASQPQTAAPAKDEKVESITYTGKVINADTGEPIQGAKVSVSRQLSRDPKTGATWREIETTDHESGPDGTYSFVVPPEQVAEQFLYLEVDAHHPNFAAKGRSGYAHSMIRKNLTMGEPPFYSEITLWPGEAITGTVVSPEGKPLPNVEILIYSNSPKSTKRPSGSFDRTTTDADGKFRIVPATPGDGVLWITPEEYSPQAHRIANRRGDWGTLTMEKGKTITGRILDAQGQPIPNVVVQARRQGDGDKPDEYLRSNAVANHIGRIANAGLAGEFKLPSLPDGEYELRFRGTGNGNERPVPLKHVLPRQMFSITNSATPQFLEIRAVPHVVIRGTWVDSAGNPRTGWDSHITGRFNGRSHFETGPSPGNDGKFEIIVPHGLERAELDVSTNEHNALRWRMSPDAPLHRGRRIQLGTLEDDVTGIQIVRYVAPVILVKPVDEQGQPVKDVTPIIKYVRSDVEGESMTVYTTGSNVSFESQPDNRWRSSQALPDEPMSVTVKKDGYETTTEEVTLKEGEQRELAFVMKKASTKHGEAANADAGQINGTLQFKKN